MWNLGFLAAYLEFLSLSTIPEKPKVWDLRSDVLDLYSHFATVNLSKFRDDYNSICDSVFEA